MNIFSLILIGIGFGLLPILYASYNKHRSDSLRDRIKRLEQYAENDYAKLKKDYEAISKLEKAILIPDAWDDFYHSPIISILTKHYDDTYKTRKKPTYIDILDERLNAVISLLGIEFKNQPATEEKLIAIKKPTKGRK